MSKYKKGKIVKGVVSGVETYGVFVKFDEFYSGLLHISEISHDFVEDITKVAEIGDEIVVEILDVDEENYRLTLSLKNINKKNKAEGKSKIRETKTGFATLQKRLDEWVDKNLENTK